MCWGVRGAIVNSNIILRHPKKFLSRSFFFTRWWQRQQIWVVQFEKKISQEPIEKSSKERSTSNKLCSYTLANSITLIERGGETHIVLKKEKKYWKFEMSRLIASICWFFFSCEKYFHELFALFWRILE